MTRFQPQKAIPNFITILNLLSGCLGILSTFYGNLELAGYLIILAAIFDFFDGFSARLLHAYSPIGKELDSLADVISFGLLPSFILFHLMREALGIPFGVNGLQITQLILLALPFSIVTFSALRLAKFNTDDRQSVDFIGLPTPASALFIAALPIIQISQPHSFFQPLITQPWFLTSLAVFLSAIMISEVPIFSLKFKSLKLNENKHRFLFLTVSIVLLIALRQSSVPLIIAFYIIQSAVLWYFFRKKSYQN